MTSISSRLTLWYPWSLITLPDYTIHFNLIVYPNIFKRYTSIKNGTLVSANQTEYPETYSASGSYISVSFIYHFYTNSLSNSYHTSHTWAINYRNSTAHEFSKSAWLRYRIFLSHFQSGKNWRGIVSLGGGYILRCDHWQTLSLNLLQLARWSRKHLMQMHLIQYPIEKYDITSCRCW